MATITGTSKNGWYLRLDYSIAQDTAKNQSTISMTLYVYDGTGYSQNEDYHEAYYILQGGKQWNPYRYDSTGLKTLGSKSVTVDHNADGTKSVTLSASWCCGFESNYTPYSLSVSETVTLPTIPRATTPSMQTATIGESVTISLPRASSGFTHTLTYAFGSASGTVATGAGSSAVWTVPLDLARQIPNSTSGTGTLTCETYNGSTLIGTKSISFTATVPETLRPTLADGWASVTYDNSGTKANGIAAWVQGYSKAVASFDGSKIGTQYGASIAGYGITYLGNTTRTSPYRTETVKTVEATVRCSVTDSRGLWAYEDFNITLNEYAMPALLGADMWRSDSEGLAADEGTYIAGAATAKYSSLGGRNSAVIRGYWKAVNGSYGEGTLLTSGQVGLVAENVSADASYVAKLEITDSLGNTAVYEEIIPTEKVAFHLKAGGNGAAFGKAAETEKCLELAEDWELKLKGMTLLNLIYPVGSIYLSVNDASPQTFFGGTWVQIKDRFLLSAGDVYTAGATGGEATHTLTASEMPCHDGHLASDVKDPDGVPEAGNYAGYLAKDKLTAYGSSGRGWNVFSGNEVHPASAGVGGGGAHNNMPPYLAVYMWKRTA